MLFKFVCMGRRGLEHLLTLEAVRPLNFGSIPGHHNFMKTDRI